MASRVCPYASSTMLYEISWATPGVGQLSRQQSSSRDIGDVESKVYYIKYIVIEKVLEVEAFEDILWANFE
ncbi:hypothetical protein BGX26_004128 [Mortierella sp. AD094]|nr:hypothetical protein BGX26_004128 [Mortierella sp. AD094]